MNVGSQVFPETLVTKPHTRLAVLSWVQEDCKEVPASPSPVWAVLGMDQIHTAPAQECLSSIQELPLPSQYCFWSHLSTRGEVEDL